MKKKILSACLLVAFGLYAANANSFDADINNNSQDKTTPAQGSTDDLKSAIISIQPVRLVDLGVGVGLSYERFVDEEGKLSLVFPVSLILNPENYYTNYQFLGYNISYKTYLYLTPGIKFYPVGDNHRVSYAVGPNISVAYGGGTTYYVPFTTRDFPARFKTFTLGVLINNYLNFNLTKEFNFTITGGFGVDYLSRSRYNIEDPNLPIDERTMIINDPIKLIGELSFGFGYRF